MTDPQSDSKPKKSRNSKAIGGAVGGGIAAVAVIVMLFVPLIPVSYQEAYKERQTRQESYVDVETRNEAYTDVETRSEAYTDVQTTQEPYTTIETQTQNLLTFEDTTINAGQSASQSVYIDRDRSVELLMSASDTLTTYVMSQSAYEANNYQYSDPVSEQSSVRYGFTAPISDTYYIVFYNPHTGFFGVDDKNVGLYSATLTATWDESVTHYKTVDVPVTKYRTVEVPVTKYHDVDVPVTKYRDVQEEVTKYRDATKNITPLDMIMGKK